MKRLLIAALAFCFAQAAAAADRIPYKVPTAIESNTGFYVGILGSVASNADYYDEARYGSYLYPNNSMNMSGGGFGVVAGWLGAYGGLRYGIEADYSKMWLKGSKHVPGCDPITCFGFSSADDYSTTLNTLATARLRIGYAFGKLMPYLTGGGGCGSVKFVDVYSTNYGYSYASTTNSWACGLVGGGGLEYALTEHWTARLEGLYVDLKVLNESDTGGFNRVAGAKAGFLRGGFAYLF